jgi:hypothetical protein
VFPGEIRLLIEIRKELIGLRGKRLSLQVGGLSLKKVDIA